MPTSQLPFKLFLLLAVVISSVTAEPRQCAQCVSGNFLHRQWLIQQGSAGQSMGWVDQWQGTDCAAGKLLVIKCYHSCITLKLQKNTENGLVDDGIMMDCADDLIHASPDLPRGVDYKVFDGEATYVAERADFTLTYTFTRESVKTQDRVVKELASFQMPDSPNVTLRGSTVILVTAVLVALAFVCFCVHCLWPKKKKQYDFSQYVTKEEEKAADPEAKKDTDPKTEKTADPKTAEAVVDSSEVSLNTWKSTLLDEIEQQISDSKL